MTERMELLGGRLRLSSRPERGTGIHAWVPLATGARDRAAATIGKLS